jgi:MYXO-CTERM domain-containing protein
MSKMLLAAGVGALTTTTLLTLATAPGCARSSGEASGSAVEALSDDGGDAPARGVVVISQVYGGGGSAGASFDHDYVELLNRGSTAVSLNGLSLQFANQGDDFGAGDASTSIVPLSGTVGPGKYLLVALASAGTDGSPLSADLSGSADLGEAEGKVALAPSTDPLQCGGNLGSRCAATKVLDLVGYGVVSDFEGTQPVPPLSITKAAIRNGSGCTDTNDNRADFSVGGPAPRNNGSDPANCPLPSPPPQKEAGGPPPPVVDPPLGPELPESDAGSKRDAGTTAASGADSGCACSSTRQAPAGLPMLALATVGLLGFIRARRRRAWRSLAASPPRE